MSEFEPLFNAAGKLASLLRKIGSLCFLREKGSLLGRGLVYRGLTSGFRSGGKLNTKVINIVKDASLLEKIRKESCEANPQRQISKDAAEERVAQTVACSRSGIKKYELCDHLSEQLFRALGGYFANFSSSVSRIGEEIS